MQVLSLVLMIAGGAAFIAGAIGLLIATFRESVLWGLGCLLLPVVGIVFIIVHWTEAKNPFLLKLVGVVLVMIGFALDPRR
jgi:hypothetical protein